MAREWPDFRSLAGFLALAGFGYRQTCSLILDGFGNRLVNRCRDRGCLSVDYGTDNLLKPVLAICFM
jgi:hypothetical protein